MSSSVTSGDVDVFWRSLLWHYNITSFSPMFFPFLCFKDGAVDSTFRDAICSNNFPDVMLTNIYNYHDLKDKQSTHARQIGNSKLARDVRAKVCGSQINERLVWGVPCLCPKTSGIISSKPLPPLVQEERLYKNEWIKRKCNTERNLIS